MATPSWQTTLTNQLNTNRSQYNNNYVGNAAISAARSQGATQQDIERFIGSQGATFGPGATESGYSAQVRRNPDKPWSHWSNIDYGRRFGTRDIRNLQSSGYSPNEIMKVGQLAYSQGDVRRTNRTNDALSALSSSILNTSMPTTYVKGQLVSDPMAAGMSSAGKPKKALGWQGFGAPLSRNIQTDLGTYKNTGSFWSMPTSLTPQGGFTPYTPKQPATESTTTETNATQPTVEPQVLPVEEPIVPPPLLPPAEDAFFAFGGASTWRGKKKSKTKNVKSTLAASRSLRNSPYSNMLGIR